MEVLCRLSYKGLPYENIQDIKVFMPKISAFVKLFDIKDINIADIQSNAR